MTTVSTPPRATEALEKSIWTEGYNLLSRHKLTHQQMSGMNDLMEGLDHLERNEVIPYLFQRAFLRLEKNPNWALTQKIQLLCHQLGIKCPHN